MSTDDSATRRIQLTFRKPWLYIGPRPTLVIDGRGQPTQWGHGTWQVSSVLPVTLGVFLFNRMWRFGTAEITVDPAVTALTYQAPVLPFLGGRIRSHPTTGSAQR